MQGNLFHAHIPALELRLMELSHCACLCLFALDIDSPCYARLVTRLSAALHLSFLANTHLVVADVDDLQFFIAQTSLLEGLVFDIELFVLGIHD